ncbi:MAG: trypsin-like serine protease, partial [Anaerolineae bacterium]
MRNKVVPLSLILLLVVAVPVFAITNGEPDGDGHPYVGLMVADDADGNPLWRCTGTLISPTVFLTAGHCTEPPAARATIWFAEDVDAEPSYPFDGDVDGTTYT